MVSLSWLKLRKEVSMDFKILQRQGSRMGRGLTSCSEVAGSSEYTKLDLTTGWDSDICDRDFGSIGSIDIKSLSAGSDFVDDHDHTLGTMGSSGLSTVEPQWGGHVDLNREGLSLRNECQPQYFVLLAIAGDMRCELTFGPVPEVGTKPEKARLVELSTEHGVVNGP